MATGSTPRTGAEIRAAFLAFYEARGHRPMASASLVPEDPTVLLTIAGMLPFKPVFLGQARPPAPRATSSQKCIRTNDIENVGRTARHHTFFEMLGNFSFGDYFKQQAIVWAWELSTQVYGLDPARLVVSVFRDDEEALAIWRDEVGVDPGRIIPMGEADNFWASGPTGPCGPCSELYYDFHPERGVEGIDLEDDERFIEFYNLVFMQYNRDGEGTLTPLANRNIDTGMGLERMAQILQGVPNNYETDLIFPLIETAAALAGITYRHCTEKDRTSLKVIADHSRAITQLIADGVTRLQPGPRLHPAAAAAAGGAPWPADRHRSTLPDGDGGGVGASDGRRLPSPGGAQRGHSRGTGAGGGPLPGNPGAGREAAHRNPGRQPACISGERAFELYDTYGFPLELTEEIAEEHGLTVDRAGFEAAMEEQRQRAKAAAVSIDLTLRDAIETVAADLDATRFRGYDTLNHPCCVLALVVNGAPAPRARAGDEVQILLDSTPFYGESGGQVGDRGLLTGRGRRGDRADRCGEPQPQCVRASRADRAGGAGGGGSGASPGGRGLPAQGPGPPHRHPSAAGRPETGGGSIRFPGRFPGGFRAAAV